MFDNIKHKSKNSGHYMANIITDFSYVQWPVRLN